MSSAPICAHIPKSFDIVAHLPPRIVLNLHAGEFGGQVEQFLTVEGADLRHGLDIVAGHDLGGDMWADAVEGLKSFLLDDVLGWCCFNWVVRMAYLDQESVLEVEMEDERLWLG
jgi:hypothetical protein